ncbi:hypothetical protein ASPACDRAFT_121268 [Aspergillus aculeatus ATCC 16872]|uniref:Uncharacterized protein n=1 Tax=Aspergillus aculeatus (strain ATCC 16872 / CBS 172.66 / WB 5094) TaxID=690307 RepID=A0A1L9WR88_ASPA1|nr:uncharacterized protein ASPACDRAFT_121268 [Aspergillus aculeatus ATCC 16872]OJJ98705.1 hypothetical protein ASPACDRAFT_121268 [Aspergillus aculeatus ATCC 16872]
MDTSFAPYLRFSDENRHPDTPALEVTLSGPRNFYTQNPTGNFFTLTVKRLGEREPSENRHKPCYFYWSPSTDEGFRVFRTQESDAQEQEVEVVVVKLSSPSPATQQSDQLHLWSLSADKDSVSWDVSLGENMFRKLEKSESVTYVLFWPGGQVYLWDWGTSIGDKGFSARRELVPKSTPIVLPGGARCAFSLVDGHVPPLPPRPTDPGVSSVTPGTPILRLELDAPATWKVLEDLPLTIKLTYHGVSGEESPRPITFSVGDLYAWGVLSAYRRRGSSGEWGAWLSTAAWGYPEFGDDEIKCTVGTSDAFMTLQPHETWHDVWPLECELSLPADARVGEVIRYRFEGCKLAWWNWGTLEDHKNTSITLTGLGGAIVDPPNNDGRPEVMIPASNLVEFTVVD